MPRKNKFATDKDLIKAVRRDLKIDEELARKVFNALKSEIKQRLLSGEKLSFANFGSFEMTKWKSDMVYDINYKAKVKKEVKTVRFKASENFKEEVLD